MKTKAKKENQNKSIKTKVIHSGGYPDPLTGAVMPPIYQTSTYAQSSPGKHLGYEYTRSHNPTRTRLQECLADCENGDLCLVTASGMSAIMLMLHTLKPQDHVLCGDDVYGGTYRLFTKVFQDFYNFHFIDTTDLKSVEAHLKKFKPKMLWLETPTNPLLKITDIKKVTALAKKFNTLTVVDNTFLGPALQNPLDLGADVVMHSMTKYINGHSDVVGGALIMKKSHQELHDKLFYLQNAIGPSQSPFDSWLVLRGIKTLSVRTRAHCENAMAVAKFLETHPRVERVVYPGLPSHPQHKIAKEQQHGFGGMITFFLKGGLKESKKFLENVKLFTLAESLGGVESLIEHPAIMTHASIPKEVREKQGIFDNLIRLSVGIEDVNELIADLNDAF